MPVIDIRENGCITPMSFIRMLAVMCHPRERDEEMRRQLTAVFKTEYLTGGGKLPLLGLFASQAEAHNEAFELLSVVNNAPPIADLLKRIEGISMRASIAAYVLYILLSARVHHSDIDISSARAFYVRSEKFKDKFPDARRPVRGVDGVEKCWKAFKGVAHFHLAQHFIWPLNAAELGGAEIMSHYTENFSAFLSLTELFRCHGAEYGFLKEAVTWRFPADLELGPCPWELGDIIPPLTTEELQYLHAYEPQYARYGSNR